MIINYKCNKILFLGLFCIHMSTAASRLAGKKIFDAGKQFVQESIKDAHKNREKLVKAGLGWGAFSGVWYAGMHQTKNLFPLVQTEYAIDPLHLKQSGIPKDTSIVYVAKQSSFNNKNNPENRWLHNGKGFWENVGSVVFGSSTPYFDDEKKLRVPVDVAEKISRGDKAATELFHQQVKDQFDRSQSAFDYKTYAACAADTALLTPLFMLNPVARAFRGYEGVASYVASASGNAAIRKVREGAVSKGSKMIYDKDRFLASFQKALRRSGD